MKNQITNEQIRESLVAISAEAKASINSKASYITNVQEQDGKLHWHISHHLGGCTSGWGETYEQALQDLRKKVGTPETRLATLRAEAAQRLAEAKKLEAEIEAASGVTMRHPESARAELEAHYDKPRQIDPQNHE